MTIFQGIPHHILTVNLLIVFNTIYDISCHICTNLNTMSAQQYLRQNSTLLTMTFHSPIAFSQFSVSLYRRFKVDNCILTQAISSHVISPTTYEISAVQNTFSAPKSSIYFGQNVNILFDWQSHPLTFRIVWYSSFADWTYGSD